MISFIKEIVKAFGIPIFGAVLAFKLDFAKYMTFIPDIYSDEVVFVIYTGFLELIYTKICIMVENKLPSIEMIMFIKGQMPDINNELTLEVNHTGASKVRCQIHCKGDNPKCFIKGDLVIPIPNWTDAQIDFNKQGFSSNNGKLVIPLSKIVTPGCGGQIDTKEIINISFMNATSDAEHNFKIVPRIENVGTIRKLLLRISQNSLKIKNKV
ncbi:MAG: hypothetical protein MR966_05215 [Lachnospiraceae bacterium]|nr:hypothetical protein [Lachnospiraceae bacterium]